MSTIQIIAQYPQLFRTAGNYSDKISLDDGIKDIKSTTATLEEIATNCPEKAKISVGLANGKTELIYQTNVETPIDLVGTTEVLKYFLKLPEEHQPKNIHLFVGSEQYLEVMETILNAHHKTMKFSKAEGLPLLARILFRIGPVIQPIPGYGSLVRELKADPYFT